MTSTSLTADLKTLFEGVVAIAKQDALKELLPAFSTMLNSMAANPTKVGATAAAAKFLVDALTALPQLESDALKYLAGAISAMAQEALSEPTAPAASAASSSAIPVVNEAVAPGTTVSATLVEPKYTGITGH